MITGTLIAVALLLGYSMIVLGSLAATFSITSAAPRLVVQNFKIKAGYKRFQALIWLACATVGGLVTALVAQGTHPWIVAGMLAGSLIAILRFNSWEARQRGMAHQILMSFVSIAGVLAGYVLAAYLLKKFT